MAVLFHWYKIETWKVPPIVGCLWLPNRILKNLPCKVPFSWTFFFSVLRKKHLVQALINADVYVCAQQIMWADRLKTNYMNKTWKIVFSSSLCFSNAHYFGCSFFLCLFLPLPLPLSLTSPIYLFVSPSVSALNSCSVTLGPRAQPWQTVAPSLESFLET